MREHIVELRFTKVDITHKELEKMIMELLGSKYQEGHWNSVEITKGAYSKC